MGGPERESTRNLLASVDGSWEEDDAPDGEKPEAVATGRVSTPDLAEVDSAWEDDDEADEPEEAEEPLPDERLDPVAYAAAKKAREEREAARRERRKARADAKRQKQKGRAELARQKQKGKQKKKPGARPTPAELAAEAEREAKKKRKEEARRAREESVRAARARGDAGADAGDDADDDAPLVRRPAPPTRPRASDGVLAKVGLGDVSPTWMLAGLVLLVLLAAAALFSVVRR